jgi:glycine dehydrogenase subunit 1
MPYVPHTPEDVRAMLEVIGVDSVDELFASLPDRVRLKRDLDLPPGLSEEEVRRFLGDLAAENVTQADLVSFLGGGVYDSIIPAACDAISSRSEFLTAYTPYQAEVSQGTLQVIYEDNHLLAVAKPPGLATMGVPAGMVREAMIKSLSTLGKRVNLM